MGPQPGLAATGGVGDHAPAHQHAERRRVAGPEAGASSGVKRSRAARRTSGHGGPGARGRSLRRPGSRTRAAGPAQAIDRRAAPLGSTRAMASLARRTAAGHPAVTVCSSARERGRVGVPGAAAAALEHLGGLAGREGEVGAASSASSPWPRRRATANGESPRDATTMCSGGDAWRQSATRNATDSGASLSISTSSRTRTKGARARLGDGRADPSRVGLGPAGLVGARVGARGGRSAR